MSCRWGAVMARSRAAGAPVMLGRKMSAAGWQGHPVFVEGGARGAPSQVGGSAGPPIGKGHRAQLCVAEFSPAWRHVPACSERVSRMRYTGATTCQKLPLGSASGDGVQPQRMHCPYVWGPHVGLPEKREPLVLLQIEAAREKPWRKLAATPRLPGGSKPSVSC